MVREGIWRQSILESPVCPKSVTALKGPDIVQAIIATVAEAVITRERRRIAMTVIAFERPLVTAQNIIDRNLAELVTFINELTTRTALAVEGPKVWASTPQNSPPKAKKKPKQQKPSKKSPPKKNSKKVSNKKASVQRNKKKVGAKPGAKSKRKISK
ncbi:2514_t:CDS:2 [Paraglomus brasilianum]|uniref:2514_t:CDS:1 n=1 Tax=Paraglomus brasilianum TaxID=144538 RepID=A0A9N9ACI5_9GLOM|nr:2514_t:CDS:2 [Paraglomus brasilianum]